MLPAGSVATMGLPESDASFERSCGFEKVAPPSVEREKKTSRFPGESSSQTTFMPPLASSAIRGLKENPDVCERLFGAEKVNPPSVERLKRMFELELVSSSHTA